MCMEERPHLAVSIWITLAGLLVLSACNMPGLRTPAPQGVGPIQTAAAQTVQAQMQTSVLPSATLPQPAPASPSATVPLLPSATMPAAASPTTAPSPTLAPSPTSLPCDLVKFVQDVTIPDNTEFTPGTAFIKTWRLQNAGTCAWSPAYALVIEGENVFNAPLLTPLPGNVPPGSAVDISVNLTAPVLAGTYRGNFKLANPSGQRFGLGDGTKPFWAQIKVSIPGGISFDLIASASLAEWKSGAGNNFDTLLAFGGADLDPNGVAKIVNNVLLENGGSSGKVLLTYPKREVNGGISGAFPPYLVQTGDALKGRLGFIANAGGICGAGRVRFQIYYKEGANLFPLSEWTKTCDGKLLPISVDLGSLKGRTIQLILVVKADGDFTDDWAIWNSLRIER